MLLGDNSSHFSSDVSDDSDMLLVKEIEEIESKDRMSKLTSKANLTITSQAHSRNEHTFGKSLKNIKQGFTFRKKNTSGLDLLGTEK